MVNEEDMEELNRRFALTNFKNKREFYRDAIFKNKIISIDISGEFRKELREFSSLISRNWKKHGPVINEQNEEGINRVTMGILVIHMPLLQQVVLPLLGLIPFTIPKMLIFLVGMVVTKFISGYLIKVLARYVPQLFGIFPDRQKTMINAEDI